MILVIPSIALREGICKYCIIGEEGAQDYYKELSNDLLSLCQLWRSENAKTLHLIDLDSFYSDNNYMNVNSIMYISQAMDIPIDVFANFNCYEECKMLLYNGVYRIVISELPISKPTVVSELIEEYGPSRISFGVIADNRNLSFKKKNISPQEYADIVKKFGGNRLFYGDKKWMEMMNVQADLDYLYDLGKSKGLQITLLEGINSSDELWNLNDNYSDVIDSVVLGRALYENNFPCQKIWRMIEAEIDANS